MKKYTVITGASSGIGYTSAIAFAERGKNLILIARREEKLAELKNKINKQFPSVDVVVSPFDLTDIDHLENLFEQFDDYFIETWVNNAGFGYHTSVPEQSISRTRQMIQLNVESLTVLSLLYVQKYSNQAGTQLINISSIGGYQMIPTAVTYGATKFYVSSFTEALALELRDKQLPLQAKVLAPAATETEFGEISNDIADFDYKERFSKYHTAEDMAGLLLKLYDSDQMVGVVDRKSFDFILSENRFEYGG
ncbi:SDR family NAD(P)-dependent oxidoreductase [Tetragenococcus muriaticus]|uniref:SDR family NAD(P)-dependent oxidoreductase n=1 Tax=Tetragenococcus muriaticus TaxID=64642 RepID=UPI000419C910|nr:SDR family NAD(P)-dependent oxidoreductase [Tetragenococcus muriaticus]GMA47582.1 oxidoreductase [Tetragenococcus muriaticus]